MQQEMIVCARSSAVQWLTEPGASVLPAIRPQLLAQLLSSPGAIVMATIMGLLVSVASFLRDGATIFVVLTCLEGLILAARLVSIARLWRDGRRGHVAIVDAAVYLSIAWCALQGMTAFFAMRTGDTVLMVLSAAMIMALIGPICARNFAAPRLALLLVCLCDFPFVIGAVTTGELWFLSLIGMTPFYLVAALQIVTNYKSAMVRALNAERENLDQARQDSLTRLLNREGLNARLDLMATTEPLAIIAMDLDGFKEINDTHGHAAGDLVLEQVADRMRSVVEDGDIVARLGGDEFLIVLPDRDPQAVQIMADRLLSAIRDDSYAVDAATRVRIGVSIGFACLPEDTRSLANLREYADEALYAAKDAGKGLTARWEGKRAVRANARIEPIAPAVACLPRQQGPSPCSLARLPATQR